MVRADAPGMTAADVKVQVMDGNVLSITGKRKHEHEEKTDKMHRVERSFGSFHRTFPLPSDANVSAISASVENGVVEISIPKLPPRAGEAPRIRDVPVHSNASHRG